MTTKPRTVEGTLRRHVLNCLLEASTGNRKPLHSFLRYDTLSKDQQAALDDLFAGRPRKRPARLMEELIVARARVQRKGERARLPAGKRLPKGRRQKILDEIVEALADAGELHQLQISMDNIKRELHASSPKRRRRPSTKR
jgi:hypothetical protein